jgi:hypothetical protein
MPDRIVEDDRRYLSERASTTVQLSAIGVMGVETVDRVAHPKRK